MTTPYTVHTGDCRDVLRDYPADHFDSIVTDPPYGLEFMGQEWDRGVPGVEFWQEALRVAKPGAHLLAFGGTRTFHRLTCAIEDAGWEIRDCLMWLYGSGFPKSLDASKAIDRMDAPRKQEERRLRFTAWVRSTGVTARQIDDATQTTMGGHYTSPVSQPAIMTREHLEACRHLFGEIPAWVESDADLRSVESENFAAREVIGAHPAPARSIYSQGLHATPSQVDLTAPATPEAAKWQGYGTALKPAWEPIIMARKPLEGTVAANLLKHGTGALNIDGARVGSEIIKIHAKNGGFSSGSAPDKTGSHKWNGVESSEHLGRWPANFMHDGSPEVLAGFPITTSGMGSIRKSALGMFGLGGDGKANTEYGDKTGSTARFFYCAKASRADREEGCDNLPERSGADAVDRDEGSAGMKSPRAGAGRTADTVRNFHPTVKPTDLMRYLCRLVTPPAGLVLDPFCGSGSTGKAALLEGLRFVGVDLDPAHVAIAEARCQFAVDTGAEQAAAAEAPGVQLALF